MAEKMGARSTNTVAQLQQPTAEDFYYKKGTTARHQTQLLEDHCFPLLIPAYC